MIQIGARPERLQWASHKWEKTRLLTSTNPEGSMQSCLCGFFPSFKSIILTRKFPMSILYWYEGSIISFVLKNKTFHWTMGQSRKCRNSRKSPKICQTPRLRFLTEMVATKLVKIFICKSAYGKCLLYTINFFPLHYYTIITINVLLPGENGASNDPHDSHQHQLRKVERHKLPVGLLVITKTFEALYFIR